MTTVTVAASTGAKIVVWREQDMFAARRHEQAGDAEICLGIDLFEVIADLAGLDLDDHIQGNEATRLAQEAQRLLT